MFAQLLGRPRRISQTAARRNASTFRQHRFESLEPRQMMAANLTAILGSDSVLRVEGTPGADGIHIRNEAGNVRVDGVVITTISLGSVHVTPEVPSSSISRIEVAGLAGNDVIAMHPATSAIPMTIRGGLGGDNIYAGAGADTIYGGEQLDSEHTGQAAARVDQQFRFFAAGSEWRNYLGLDEKWFLGGASQWYYLRPNGDIYKSNAEGTSVGTYAAHVDPAYHSNLAALLDAESGPTAALIDRQVQLYSTGDLSYNWGGRQEKWVMSQTQNAWYFITPDGALYRWTQSGFAIGALAAQLDTSFWQNIDKLVNASTLFSDNDIIYGYAGGDTILGGADIDYVRAGQGVDWVLGGAGIDTIYGEASKDYLFGDDGNDTMDGGDGDDNLFGGVGNDIMRGGAGLDQISGEHGADILYGGAHADTLRGGDGLDKIFGELGNDVLYGDAGNDTLEGGDGADSLDGGLGSDILRGGDSDDTLWGGDGHDQLFGDAGLDQLFGDGGSDKLWGGDARDKLYGGAQYDYLYGQDGDDWLDAGAPGETVDGGVNNNGTPGRDFNAYVTTVGGANLFDINQGDTAPTCWILAAIGAVGRYEDLSQRIRYVGGDTYEVSLYNRRVYSNPFTGGFNRVVERVTFDGTRQYPNSDPDFTTQEGESWVIILQRAIIQAISKWDATQSLAAPHSGGATDPLSILVGVFGTQTATSSYANIDALADLMYDGKRVVIDTAATTSTLVANHQYTLLGKLNGNVYLCNPWGFTVTVTWEQFLADTDVVMYV